MHCLAQHVSHFSGQAHVEGHPAIRYELRELERFRAYRRRLIVQWKSTRGWVQKKDLDIYEVLPATLSTLFPGYQDVLLGFDELKWIFADPRAHRDWKSALESNAGIYRIVDLSTGKIYIGSAYGSEGIWGRWQNYAKTGHGATSCSRIVTRRTFNGPSCGRSRRPCRRVM